jgi:hypothetical protein
VTATNGVGTSGHCGEVTATAQVISSGNPCTLPGVTITSDPAGDQNGAPANAQLDITEVDVAEPYPSPAGSSSLVFTIKVPGLSQLPALQPNAEWKVSFNVKDTTGASRIVFVEADTNDPTKPFGEFSYGYTGGTTDNGEGGTGVTGTFNTADGTIVIILDTSKPLAFAPGIGTTDLPFNVTFPAGTVLNAVTGTTVALIGSQPGGIGGGLLLTVDSTSPGTYSVKGNAFCRPDGPVLAVLQASPNTGCTPLTVSFDGSQSFDAAGDTIASYTFNFGDGSAPLTQSSPHATYSYSRAGDYAASLKVTCSRGATSGNVAEAQVAVSAPPAAPVISAPSTAKPGQKGLVASVASHSGSSYPWSVSNGTITGGQGTSSITFTAGLKGNVGLSVTEISAAGCVSPAGTATVTSKK